MKPPGSPCQLLWLFTIASLFLRVYSVDEDSTTDTAPETASTVGNRLLPGASEFASYLFNLVVQTSAPAAEATSHVSITSITTEERNFSFDPIGPINGVLADDGKIVTSATPTVDADSVFRLDSELDGENSSTTSHMHSSTTITSNIITTTPTPSISNSKLDEHLQTSSDETGDNTTSTHSSTTSHRTTAATPTSTVLEEDTDADFLTESYDYTSPHSHSSPHPTSTATFSLGDSIDMGGLFDSEGEDTTSAFKTISATNGSTTSHHSATTEILTTRIIRAFNRTTSASSPSTRTQSITRTTASRPPPSALTYSAICNRWSSARDQQVKEFDYMSSSPPFTYRQLASFISSLSSFSSSGNGKNVSIPDNTQLGFNITRSPIHWIKERRRLCVAHLFDLDPSVNIRVSLCIARDVINRKRMDAIHASLPSGEVVKRLKLLKRDMFEYMKNPASKGNVCVWEVLPTVAKTPGNDSVEVGDSKGELITPLLTDNILVPILGLYNTSVLEGKSVLSSKTGPGAFLEPLESPYDWYLSIAGGAKAFQQGQLSFGASYKFNPDPRWDITSITFVPTNKLPSTVSPPSSDSSPYFDFDDSFSSSKSLPSPVSTGPYFDFEDDDFFQSSDPTPAPTVDPSDWEFDEPLTAAHSTSTRSRSPVPTSDPSDLFDFDDSFSSEIPTRSRSSASTTDLSDLEFDDSFSMDDDMITTPHSRTSTPTPTPDPSDFEFDDSFSMDDDISTTPRSRTPTPTTDPSDFEFDDPFSMDDDISTTPRSRTPTSTPAPTSDLSDLEFEDSFSTDIPTRSRPQSSILTGFDDDDDNFPTSTVSRSPSRPTSSPSSEPSLPAMFRFDDEETIDDLQKRDIYDDIIAYEGENPLVIKTLKEDGARDVLPGEYDRYTDFDPDKLPPPLTSSCSSTAPPSAALNRTISSLKRFAEDIFVSNKTDTIIRMLDQKHGTDCLRRFCGGRENLTISICGFDSFADLDELNTENRYAGVLGSRIRIGELVNYIAKGLETAALKRLEKPGGRAKNGDKASEATEFEKPLQDLMCALDSWEGGNSLPGTFKLDLARKNSHQISECKDLPSGSTINAKNNQQRKTSNSCGNFRVEISSQPCNSLRGRCYARKRGSAGSDGASLKGIERTRDAIASGSLTRRFAQNLLGDTPRSWASWASMFDQFYCDYTNHVKVSIGVWRKEAQKIKRVDYTVPRGELVRSLDLLIQEFKQVGDKSKDRIARGCNWAGGGPPTIKPNETFGYFGSVGADEYARALWYPMNERRSWPWTINVTRLHDDDPCKHFPLVAF
ncbi:hypothetical protein TWF730_010167 [Orbilia blumenaviensis]|uniref:Uncharacterized protein n=1 Tax=Orbilia blumenaviensis TaxID=1796055 RepID=A0AAV9UR91_9PEZI